MHRLALLSGIVLALLPLAAPARAQESVVARAAFRPAEYESEPVLEDPGFESGTTHWTLHPDQTSFDDTVAFEGKASLRIRPDLPYRDTGAHQEVALDRTEARPLHLRASSRSDYLPGNPGGGYAVTMQIRYMEARADSWVVLSFPPGPGGWVTRERVFVPLAPVRSVNVRAALTGGIGTVWFDAVSVSELDAGWASANFDGAGLMSVASPLGEEERAGALRLATKDERLAISLTPAGGCVAGLDLEGSNFADPTSMAVSGFSIRDAATGDIHKVRLPVRAQPSHLRQEGGLPALGLQFTGTIAWKRDHLEITAKVENKKPEDRMVTVYFTLPVDATGWTWWDTLRGGRRIGGEGDYSVTRHVRAGGSGTLSMFPAAAVTGSVGLAAWVPADGAPACRLGYCAESREFYVAFDAALCARAGKPPNQAAFVFHLAPVAPSQGLREAVARMHADQPEVFAARKVPEGGVVDLGNAAAVAGWRDFGVVYRTIPWFRGDIDFAEDDKAGISSLLGIDPQTAILTRDDAPRGAADLQDTVDRALKLDPGGQPGLAALREVANMVSACGLRKAGGEWDAVYNAGGKQVLFTANPDPDLRGAGEFAGKAQAAFRVKDLSALYGVNKRGTLDGHWVGSFDTGSDLLDFRPAALQAADFPPVWDTALLRPAVLLGSAKREFLDGVAAEVHKRRKVLLGHNGPEWYWPLAAPFDAFYFDVQPAEVGNLGQPVWDWLTLYRLALAGDRPVTYALSFNYNKVDAAAARTFLNFCAFYGVWPSWLDHRPQPGISEPVWATPAWMESLRGATRETVELVRELRQAGWRPATWATIAAPLRVERWGDHKPGTLAFSLLNPTGQRQSGTLQVDAAGLDLPSSGIKVKTRAGSALPATSPAPRRLDVPVELDAWELLVIQIRRG